MKAVLPLMSSSRTSGLFSLSSLKRTRGSFWVSVGFNIWASWSIYVTCTFREYHYYSFTSSHFIYFSLVFLYGTDRVPVGGFSKRSLKILLSDCPDAEDRLPEAQTCFGRLILPKYSDINTLSNKLIHAISFCEVFGREWTSLEVPTPKYMQSSICC